MYLCCVAIKQRKLKHEIMKNVNEKINSKKLFLNHLNKSDRYLACVKCGFGVSHLFISELKK